jgi:hypothetical protein
MNNTINNNNDNLIAQAQNVMAGLKPLDMFTAQQQQQPFNFNNGNSNNSLNNAIFNFQLPVSNTDDNNMVMNIGNGFQNGGGFHFGAVPQGNNHTNNNTTAEIVNAAINALRYAPSTNNN